MKRSILLCLAVVCALAAQPAEAGYRRAAGKPIKNRYIVMLRDTPAAEVDAVAKRLTREHRGRLIATMQHAMRGFGVVMSEAQARALSHHPLVALVEEDEEVQLASAAPQFDFTALRRQPALPQKKSGNPFLTETLANNCAWQPGGYFACFYGDDTFWNLDRLDNQGQIYGTKAYAFNSTGMANGVRVRAYVVDTGVYAAHSEFDGRVEAGANMVWDPAVADVDDPGDGINEEEPIERDGWPADNPCGGWMGDPNAGIGHGTGVASVIGGTNTGVAKEVTIVPVKVFNCAGAGSKLAIARGLDWIQSDMVGRPGRAVVNMSLAFNANAEMCEGEFNVGFTNCTTAVEHEINTLVGSNIVVVVSANNQNENRCALQVPARLGYGNEAGYPSTHRTITVGGTMYTDGYVDQRWTCADQPGGCVGAESIENPGSNFGACVSVWAPAWNIEVAGASGANSYRTTFRHRSGTSFASPYVAGIAARLLARYPNLSARQVYDEIVFRSGQRWGAPDFDPTAGIDNRRLVYMSPFE